MGRQLNRYGAMVSALALGLALLPATIAWAGPDREGDTGDRTERVLERAARDAARAQEQADRDAVRYAEERADILQSNQDDPVRQQEDLARLDADLQDDLIKAQEDAARDSADYAEELAKVAEDEADDTADQADDRAEDSADDSAGDSGDDSGEATAETADYGDSAAMREVASEEAPDFDQRGFPVRRGEVVALDLSDTDVAAMQNGGFRLIGSEDLSALGSRIARLAAPPHLDAAGALREAQRIAPQATFDYTHYYRMPLSPAGDARRGEPAHLPQRSGSLSVGMIDTGVIGHAALRRAAIEARDFGDPGAAVPTAHGTAIASILVSEGTRKLYVANVFRGTNGEPFTSADALARALEWLVARHVPVVNMSLAGPRNAILDRLVMQSVQRGTLIVAAAGNGGPGAPPAYPAALSPVIAVTAVDQRDRVYRYANQGNYITVAARGVDEPAADTAGGVSRFSGTSFATPHVTAWLARCLQKDLPAACARTLRTTARDLGTPGRDPVYGHGLLTQR